MKIIRKKTRQIHVGGVTVGGDAPVRVQSMTNTKTADASATIAQIMRLKDAGCEIIRVSVPDQASADALRDIVKESPVPVIADIHFDWRMAIAAMDAGANGIRVNPGNIKAEDISAIIGKAKEMGVAIRLGINAGSLKKDILKKYLHPVPEALVESALDAVKLAESLGYYNLKISVKGSSVPATIDSYRLLSEKTDYPLHIGVTEAGPFLSGTVKSSVGLGILLSEGIGDTMRVSLTADPVEEVRVAREILKSLDLKAGLSIVSCPTCARCQTQLIPLAEKIEELMAPYRDFPITVAVMGCVVNGPGEAREADVGIAAGRGSGILFKKGEPERKIAEADFLDELMKAVKEIVDGG